MKDELLNSSRHTQRAAEDFAIYDNPVVVPYDGDETVTLDYYTGYTFTASNFYVDNVQVNEEFADENEVWVITPNENVNNEGIMVSPPNFTNNTLNTNLTSNTTNFPSLFISDAIFKSDKESWIKGANEIYIQYGYSWQNGINPTSGNIDFTRYKFLTGNPLYAYNSVSQPLNATWDHEIFLAKVKNKDIKKSKNFNLDKTISTSFAPNYPNYGTHMFLVVYEQDGIGSLIFGGKQNAKINGFETGMYFISNDPPYLTACLEIVSKSSTKPKPNTDYAHIINDEIDFTSLYR